MNTAQRIAQWRRKLFWRRAFMGALGVLCVIGIIAGFSWYQRTVASPAPSLDEPSAQPSESLPAPELAELHETSERFAKLYYSYDWQAPADRVKKLAVFGKKSWYATVKKAEKDIKYRSMRKHQTVKTVLTVELQDGDTNTDESQKSGIKAVMLNVTVEVKDDSSAQAIITEVFSCTLWWEYDAKSETWLISQADLS